MAASRTTVQGWRICSRRDSSSMASRSSRGSARGSWLISQRAQTLSASGSRPQRATRRGPRSSSTAAASGSTWQRQRSRRTASCSESSPISTTLSGANAWPFSAAGGLITAREVTSTCMCGLSASTSESHRRKAGPHFWKRPWQPSRMSSRCPGSETRWLRKDVWQRRAEFDAVFTLSLSPSVASPSPSVPWKTSRRKDQSRATTHRMSSTCM
mmetsp:Transcript_8548/g.25184  ORF Transcript_8548/g.25184 Transcript_8548/m.25184 type:complete len:213 (+) Transcript_8548:279-917(+)